MTPMVGDLQRRILRIGVDRAAVQSLLGKPDHTSDPSELLSHDPEYLKARTLDHYKIGLDGFGMDDLNLVIAYDTGNRLVGSWVVQS